MKQSEQQIIEEFIGIAYNMSQFAIEKLDEKNAKNCNEFLSLIYSDVSDEIKNTLIDTYFDVRKFIERKLHIQRTDVFVDDKNQENFSVLASANLDENIIVVFDAFFKKAEGDEENLNSRATVLMHEIAHLLGLTSDAELNDINSAEAFRNFTLLVCEIITPEILFPSKENDKKLESAEDENLEEEESLVGEDGELPYNPNRHPAGSSQGGQFAPKDGGGVVDEPTDEPKEKNPKTNSKDEESHDDKNKSDEDEKKVKAHLQLINGGVKYDESEKASRSWAAANLKIEGLEPDTHKTLVLEYEYGYENNLGEDVIEDAKIALDIMTDEDGNIDLKRAGIVGEYSLSKDSDKWKGTDLNIKISVSTIDGSVKENYGNPENISLPGKMGELTPSPKMVADQDNYRLAYYPAAHAANPNEKWFDTKRPTDATGGGIAGRKDPSNIKLADEFEMQYDSKTGKTNLLKGSMTADGKGYDDR